MNVHGILNRARIRVERLQADPSAAFADAEAARRQLRVLEDALSIFVKAEARDLAGEGAVLLRGVLALESIAKSLERLCGVSGGEGQ